MIKYSLSLIAANNKLLKRGLHIYMKSLKTILLGTTLAAGIGLSLGAGNVHADSLYKVQAGDTLSSIAAKNHTNIQEVANKNQISNINMIYEGQQLQIKTADSAVATPKTMQATPIAQPALSTTPMIQKQAPAQTSAPTSDSNSAKEWIAQRESSGSYNATNGKYIGRYQLDASYLKGDYSPANQEKVAENYVSERYGSWEQAKTFWMNNGWY